MVDFLAWPHFAAIFAIAFMAAVRGCFLLSLEPLPDKNVRPIVFLKSLHSSPPLPAGRQASR
jgi:hypothetical protein